MKKKIISALLAAVMVFSLTACGGGSDKKSADGTYYNTYLDTDPTTMDPVKGNDTYSMGILRNIMEPLTRLEEDGDKQERKVPEQNHGNLMMTVPSGHSIFVIISGLMASRLQQMITYTE